MHARTHARTHAIDNLYTIRITPNLWTISCTNVLHIRVHMWYNTDLSLQGLQDFAKHLTHTAIICGSFLPSTMTFVLCTSAWHLLCEVLRLNHGLETSYPDWGFLLFLLFPQNKCWESTLQCHTSCNILCKFIIHTDIPSFQLPNLSNWKTLLNNAKKKFGH
jgi:hypothetical protein